jgi:uncharacterized membrane protein YgdD (TMEM256/DUF423 family)
MTQRWIAIVGALLAGTAVAAGAVHAHGLRDKLLQLGWDSNLEQRLAWFDTAVRYQMYHALALLALAGVVGAHPAGGFKLAAALFLLGVALFSGSLYAMTFLGPAWRKLGAVTPLGGLALIIAWLAVVITTWRTL